jgi:hypothetical protein
MAALTAQQFHRPDAIEKQLAHVESNKVRATYNKALLVEERHQIMQAWGDYLAMAEAGNVVPHPLRPKAASPTGWRVAGWLCTWGVSSLVGGSPCQNHAVAVALPFIPLQFRPYPPDAASDPGHGCRCHGPREGDRGSGRSASLDEQRTEDQEECMR